MFKHVAIAVALAGCWTSPPPKQPEPAPPPKKVKIVDIVQPVRMERIEPEYEEDEEGPFVGHVGGVQGVVVGGVYGGVQGGVVGGVATAPPPPPPPPPPPSPPQNVAPSTLEGSRIAGNPKIAPDVMTRSDIVKSGKDKVVASFKLCVDAGGSIAQVALLKSSGFPTYDRTIELEIRNTWRYSPFMVNGRVVPVCTAVTFIFSQH